MERHSFASEERPHGSRCLAFMPLLFKSVRQGVFLGQVPRSPWGAVVLNLGTCSPHAAPRRCPNSCSVLVLTGRNYSALVAWPDLGESLATHAAWSLPWEMPGSRVSRCQEKPAKSEALERVLWTTDSSSSLLGSHLLNHWRRGVGGLHSQFPHVTPVTVVSKQFPTFSI